MKMAIINYINALKMGNAALLSCAHLGGMPVDPLAFCGFSIRKDINFRELRVGTGSQ
ncbi:TPA: hypothetical protein I8287_004728 [Kluyvera intermedia]|nr:hypothetical protein [Kluyvera intermedia]